MKCDYPFPDKCEKCIHEKVCYMVGECFNYIPDFECDCFEEKRPDATFEWSEDHKDQIIGWLSKFCFHVDMIDKHLTDDEAREFWEKKMHDQFGW